MKDIALSMIRYHRPNKGRTLSRLEKKQAEQAERFKNPLVCRNIETGEGYSRLDETWKYEGVEVIRV